MSGTLNDDVLHSELVIGLVGAVGTDMRSVIRCIEDRLALAGYETRTIKVSRDVIQRLDKQEASSTDHYLRINGLMDRGNDTREKATKWLRDNGYDRSTASGIGNSILALGASSRIFAHRTNDGVIDPGFLSKTAFIIDSLKRPEEVERLRQTYPSGFVLMGVHAEEDQRREHLTKYMNMSPEDANKLMQRDFEESDKEYGQRLNQTFYLGDFFVRSSEREDRLKADLSRIIDALFGHPNITPTFDEYAMFMAYAAALKSADLSRQVGAVIARNKEILSTGANDCPRAGGGQYWPDRYTGSAIVDEPNGRDYKRHRDQNRVEQLDIIDQIVEAAEKVPDLKTHGAKIKDLLKASRIRDLTEFGRMVHAEMDALLACARLGTSTLGATLYCTTFPCHNCAKHIVAAGLERVVYVQPYPKSKALDFHDDSIVMTSKPPETGQNRVRFQPFVGIGPRRFFDLFSMQLSSGYDLERKDPETGAAKDFSIAKARLRVLMNPASYIDLEATAQRLYGDITGEK